MWWRVSVERAVESGSIMSEMGFRIGDLRRRIVGMLIGEDDYDEPLLDRVVREARGALVVSPQGRVFAPPVIEIEIHPEDVSAFLDAVGTADPTAYVRHRVDEAVRDVCFPDDFRIDLLEADQVPPGRPQCVTRAPRLDLTPFLASEAEGIRASAGRRLPLDPETVINREWLSPLVPADMEISRRRHAVITIVSRRRVEIRPVPNRYTAVDGAPLIEREILNYRESGYRLTFGGRQLLLFWVEQFRTTPTGGQG
jgi:hypothetical protein